VPKTYAIKAIFVNHAPSAIAEDAEADLPQRSGPVVETIQDRPDRPLIQRPVSPAAGSPWSTQPGQVLLSGRPDPLPDRGEPVVVGGGERAQRDRDKAAQR
jgi:hypothetical protein